jgi:hypothetical protein
MQTLRLLRIVSAVLVVGATTGGCSNLCARKVPVGQRICGKDHQQGFRYYLNRPYLVVKKPIPLYERKTLVTAESAELQKFLRESTVDLPTGKLPATSGGEVGAAVTADTTSLTPVTLTDPTDDKPSLENFEIVYLPDMDEQYVVKNCNFLAKSAFALTFKNGTELTDVQGEHDSTTLTVSLLDQVQKAIKAAQGVAQEQIQHDAKANQSTPGKGGGGAALTDDAKAVRDQGLPLYQRIETVYIRPGMYRLNKPWETVEGVACPPGSGLLAQLGLPTCSDVKFESIGTITP